MKRYILYLVLFFMMLDSADAQMIFEPMANRSDATILRNSDFDDLVKKRRKKRKKGRRGRGSDLSMIAGAHAGLGLPFGDLGESTNMGFGGGVDGVYFIQPQLGIGLTTGFYSFGYKDDAGLDGSISFVPIMPQAWYLFGETEFKPYAGLGLGLYLENSYYSITVPHILGIDPDTFMPIYLDTEVSESTSQTDFGLAPMAGILYELSDNLHLNVNLKYNMVFSSEEVVGDDGKLTEQGKSLSYLGLNFGVVLNLE